MVIFVGFILGLLIGGTVWHLERRQYDKLWEDYRKLLNHIAVKAGGKPIYPAPKVAGTTVTPRQTDLPRIMTYDMAVQEAEIAEEEAERARGLTPADLEHLGLN